MIFVRFLLSECRFLYTPVAHLVGVGEAKAAGDGTQAADTATGTVHHGTVDAVVLIIG